MSENPSERPNLSSWDKALKHAFSSEPIAGEGTVQNEPLEGIQAWNDDSRFELIAKIAQGGMGVVYRAFDQVMEREVAIKILRADRASLREWEFLKAEGLIAARLDHPCIVPIFDIRRSDTGQLLVVMRLVEGTNLKGRIGPNQDLGSERAQVEILLRVAQAVAFAHQRGIVHRDLKPSNIMLGQFGEVQVLDWGLAKILNPASSSSHINDREPGSVVGTLSYMSPEQARGATDQVGTPADLFALGAMLHEILTGYRPYDGSEHDSLLAAARAGDLGPAQERLSELGALGALAGQCLEADPDKRLDDALEFATQLISWIESEDRRLQSAEHAMASAQAELAHQRKLRRRTQVAATALAIAAVVIVGGAYAWSSIQDQRREDARAVVTSELSAARALTARAMESQHLDKSLALHTAAEQAVERAIRAAGDTLEDADWLQRLDDAQRNSRLNVQSATDRVLKAQARSELVERLDALRFDDGFLSDELGIARTYAQLFTNQGIDPWSEDAQEQIAHHANADLLRQALSQWVVATYRSRRTHEPQFKSIQSLSQRLDSGGQRERLVLAFQQGTLAALREVVASPEFDANSVHNFELAAEMLAIRGVPEEAVALLDHRLARSPSDSQLARSLASWCAASTPPRYQRTRDLIRAALATRATSIHLHCDLVAICLLDEQVDEAKRWLDLADRIVPSHPRVIYHQAVLLDSAGESEQALSLVDDLLTRVPHYAMAHRLKAQILLRSRQLGPALASAKKALSINPRSAAAWGCVGSIRVLQGKHSDALKCFKKAADVAPWDHLAWHGVAVASHHLQRLDEALSAAQMAVKLRPSNGNNLNMLGLALHSQGRFQEALANWKAAQASKEFENSRDRLRTRIRNAGFELRMEKLIRVTLSSKDLPKAKDQDLIFRFLAKNKLWARSATVWKHLFRLAPTQATPRALLDAAAAAARSALSQGIDPYHDCSDRKAQQRWLNQCHDWLLQSLNQQTDSTRTRRRFQAALSENPFSAIRNSLPEFGDKEAWKELWIRVDQE